ncbi:MAG: hypothetical protein H5T80_15755, partial [Dietzia sp.]|nr:hypothetical protein [Dietzia sp.]
VGVATARQRAAARYERSAAGWATGPVADLPRPALELPLHPPSEREALADPAGAVQWVSQWRDVDGAVWERRQWPSVGAQDVPERVVLATPAAVARFCGRERHWRTLAGRAEAMVARWGDGVRPVLRRHARALAELADDDVARLTAVVDWLVAHPGSGLYLRQLPVEGVSTKWIEPRRAFVTGMVLAVTGEPGLGLANPAPLVRVRALDRDLAPGAPGDVTAPVDQLDAWGLRPRRVVVVENLQTFLALPALRGVAAVHGGGYAVDLLGRIGWVTERPILYWGDLDRDGFAILGRVRAHCSDVTSVLMDEATLLSHRHLWTADPTADSGAALTRLTVEEQRTLELTRVHGGVRLEQERLAWPLCVATLERAVAE